MRVMLIVLPIFILLRLDKLIFLSKGNRSTQMWSVDFLFPEISSITPQYGLSFQVEKKAWDVFD